MKAPKQRQLETPVPHGPDRQPTGARQLWVDGSARQRARRDYVGYLLPDREAATIGQPAAQRASATDAPAQLVNGKGKGKTKKKKVPNYRRFPTAYGVTTGTRNQGPHTIPHIAKKLAVENAYKRNSKFNVHRIRTRTGLIPSPGQARRLIRMVEKSTGTKIPDTSKKKHDLAYKRQLKIKQTGTPQQQDLATFKLLELNPLATYSLHQKASHGELRGKGERKTTVEPDLIKMSNMKKGGLMPKFSKVDRPKKQQHREKHLEKFLRDTGKLYKGEDDHSDMELSSDDEY